MFRSQGPSALTSHRNDGTVSSNILLVNEHVWAFGRFSQLSISVAFIWHFTAAKWCLFSRLCQNWTRLRRGITQNHIINMRVVITLFWARKLTSTFLLPSVWSCAYPWHHEDRSVWNKLHWDRNLGCWLRQSALSVHLPKCETLRPLFRLSSLSVVETFRETSRETGNDFAGYWGWD